jgi:hypothetical protein
VAAGSFCTLLLGLAAIDDRVRDRIALALGSGGPTREITTVGSHLNEIASIAFQALRDQSIEHAPLVIFALAALVLVLLLTRT